MNLPTGTGSFAIDMVFLGLTALVNIWGLIAFFLQFGNKFFGDGSSFCDWGAHAFYVTAFNYILAITGSVWLAVSLRMTQKNVQDINKKK